jgi:hypothetical protein
MTNGQSPKCSTSNCDNKATVDVGPMLVCGRCHHGMLHGEKIITMDAAAREQARKLVAEWCDPKPPDGWAIVRPGYLQSDNPLFSIEVHDARTLIRIDGVWVRVTAVDAVLRSVNVGSSVALAHALEAALDDGDCLRGVIARAIRASDSIADNDAEDVIQEMLAILLEAEPEGRDDTVEWARMEGANAMLELIVAAGYGARGISDNREGLRKAVAELAVAATMPRKPEPEFEAALLQREVEQLRAQLDAQRESANERVEKLTAEWRAEPDRLLILLGERTRERDQARSLAAEFRTRAKVEAQDVRREGATWEKYVAWVNAGTTGMHGELRWGIAEDVPTAENVDQYIADDIRWMVEDADACQSGWDLLAEIAAMVIE